MRREVSGQFHYDATIGEPQVDGDTCTYQITMKLTKDISPQIRGSTGPSGPVGPSEACTIL